MYICYIILQHTYTMKKKQHTHSDAKLNPNRSSAIGSNRALPSDQAMLANNISIATIIDPTPKTVTQVATVCVLSLVSSAKRTCNAASRISKLLESSSRIACTSLIFISAI